MKQINNQDLISYLINKYPTSKKTTEEPKEVKKEYFSINPTHNKNNSFCYTTMFIWLIIIIIIIFITINICKK